MKNKHILVLGVVTALLIGVYVVSDSQEANGELDAFAQCLADKGITMYGAGWCSHCQNEKKAFGASFRLVPYVECPDDPEVCLSMNIKGYPTWILADGKRLEGEQGLDNISRESGCLLLTDR